MISQLRNQGLVPLAIWSLLLATTILAAFEGRWSLSFVAFATLCLAIAPLVLARWLDITLPLPFVIATTLFIVASVFLGEAFDFYERLWWWDLFLHGSSAVGFGLLGFLFVLMMFEGDRYAAPPWAISFLAFALAATVGTIWEIFEFSMDQWFGLNMQKSGLPDTMGDLIVNLIGAAFASLIGLGYLVAKTTYFWSQPVDSFIKLNKRLFRKWR